MSDSYTEVTSQGWFSRIGASIKGILFGIIAIPLCIILLWWNEGRAVTTAKSLKEGAAAVVDVSADKIDAANDKRLVHVTGDIQTTNGVLDDEFGIKLPALRLERSVEIYQWDEDKKTEKRQKVGGSEETITTYTYSKKWVNKPIDSSGFKKPEGHENKGGMIGSDKTFTASDATLGAFKVPESMIHSLPGSATYALKDSDLRDEIKTKARLSEGRLYYGNDPAKPQIGDQRVAFEIVNPGTFSVLAAQQGDTFGPYQTKAGDAIHMIDTGAVSAEVMFKEAEKANTIITWLVRFLGFLFMSFGFMAIMRPLSVLGSVVPFIGDLIGAGTGLVSFVLAGTISLVVIAIAWLAARPLLGIVLLVLAVGGLLYMRKLAAGAKPAPTPAPAA